MLTKHAYFGGFTEPIHAGVKTLPFLLVLGYERGLALLDVALQGGFWQHVHQESDDCAVMHTLHQVLPFKSYHLNTSERREERDA